MREIELEGQVGRVEVGEWTDKKGLTHPRGTVVLRTMLDKFEISLDGDAGADTVGKLRSIQKGETVKLHVGISSGDGFRSDPRFTFLDDLTLRK